MFRVRNKDYYYYYYYIHPQWSQQGHQDAKSPDKIVPSVQTDCQEVSQNSQRSRLPLMIGLMNRI